VNRLDLRHIGIVLLAANLAGCGAYTMFDPDAASSFTSSGKPPAWLKNASQSSTDDDADTTASAPAPSSATKDRSDSAAMNSLFARASDSKAVEPKSADASPPAQLAKSDAKSDAKPAPPPKPVVLADATPTTIPRVTPVLAEQPPVAAAKIAEPQGRAYLFRGIAGLIYSRGMDKLADRIKRAGIPSSVDTYLMWRPVVAQAIRDYRRDPQPIILIGHSMGGDSALAFAETLNAENIPVSLLITYDPSRIADDVPPNVERYINIFQSTNMMGGGNVVQGQRFHGHYASYNLKDHNEIIHINIEKTDRIQEQLVAKVKELAATPASAEGEAVPLRLEVPADAAIELWDSGLPIAARGGDTLKTIAATYHVPLWSLTQINSMSERASLTEGQRIVVPRHLVPMATPSTVTSYAPVGR
jgi:LysM domain